MEILHMKAPQYVQCDTKFLNHCVFQDGATEEQLGHFYAHNPSFLSITIATKSLMGLFTLAVLLSIKYTNSSIAI